MLFSLHLRGGPPWAHGGRSGGGPRWWMPESQAIPKASCTCSSRWPRTPGLGLCFFLCRERLWTVPI
eukprot:5105381-Pyramimonas_sp.AAC.1